MTKWPIYFLLSLIYLLNSVFDLVQDRNTISLHAIRTIFAVLQLTGGRSNYWAAQHLDSVVPNGVCYIWSRLANFQPLLLSMCTRPTMGLLRTALDILQVQNWKPPCQNRKPNMRFWIQQSRAPTPSLSYLLLHLTNLSAVWSLSLSQGGK